jgi:hypothetical protein
MNVNTSGHLLPYESKRALKRWTTSIIVAAAAWSVATTAAGQTMHPTADPRIGTWKLNLAESIYPPGLAPQSQSLKWETVEDGGYKLTTDGVDADGQAIHTEAIGKLDGTDHAVQGGASGGPARTAAVRRLDDRTFESVTTLKGANGEMVSLVRVQKFSADGRSMTSLSSRRDPQGRILPIMAVYDKQ